MYTGTHGRVFAKDLSKQMHNNHAASLKGPPHFEDVSEKSLVSGASVNSTVNAVNSTFAPKGPPPTSPWLGRCLQKLILRTLKDLQGQRSPTEISLQMG